MVLRDKRVKRFLCLLLFSVFAVTMAYSENVEQDTVKKSNNPVRLAVGTNLLYLAALAPNASVEYYFPHSQWSVTGTFTMPWWKRKSQHQYYQIRQYLAEGRYWFHASNHAKRHFVGINVHGGLYDLENKKTGYYGEFVGTSLTYGYRIDLNKKMALELSIGGGYIFTKYDKYLPKYNGYAIQSSHITHYWGVTKASISLVWNIMYHKR